MFDAKALAEIIADGNIRFVQNSVSYIFDCPKCQKRKKLYMRKSDGRFICFVCAGDGFSGRAEKALVELYGGNYADYSAKLRGERHLTTFLEPIELDDIWGESEALVECEPEFNGMEWGPWTYELTEPQGEPGLRYLESRGLSKELCVSVGIRYSLADNRVLFPWRVNGELVGWQGRYCGKTEIYDPTTGTAKNIPKALTTVQDGVAGYYPMFGDSLRNGVSHCILTEGPVSALKCAHLGGAVASMGKAMATDDMISWIARQGVRKLYVGLDPDAGDDISRVVKSASNYGMTCYLLLPPGNGAGEYEDLGDCPVEVVTEQFRNAKQVTGNHLLQSFGGSLCL